MFKNKRIIIIAVIVLVTASIGFFIVRYKAQAKAKHYVVSSWEGDHTLLARLVAGEAEGEPYAGQVGVAAVIINRSKHAKFPPTIADVVYQSGAFESVSNGLIWSRYPSRSNFDAARQAMDGWDPTYGCIFFWNPYKPVSSWIWSRSIITQIGRHVFAK
ncbi:MAG TPA: spore cortex-lytic protein [Thermoanaerobacterales bacterium]|nr:spore cortex-lytic protein [Thermoanaerobacterales bacterium]